MRAHDRRQWFRTTATLPTLKSDPSLRFCRGNPPDPTHPLWLRLPLNIPTRKPSSRPDVEGTPDYGLNIPTTRRRYCLLTRPLRGGATLLRECYSSTGSLPVLPVPTPAIKKKRCRVTEQFDCTQLAYCFTCFSWRTADFKCSAFPSHACAEHHALTAWVRQSFHPEKLKYLFPVQPSQVHYTHTCLLPFFCIQAWAGPRNLNITVLTNKPFSLEWARVN